MPRFGEEITPMIIKSLLLVGGFAESAYLQVALRERLLVKGVKQVKIDEATYVPLLFQLCDTEVSAARRLLRRVPLLGLQSSVLLHEPPGPPTVWQSESPITMHQPNIVSVPTSRWLTSATRRCCLAVSTP